MVAGLKHPRGTMELASLLSGLNRKEIFFEIVQETRSALCSKIKEISAYTPYQAHVLFHFFVAKIPNLFELCAIKHLHINGEPHQNICIMSDIPPPILGCMMTQIANVSASQNQASFLQTYITIMKTTATYIRTLVAGFSRSDDCHF
ncbi:unnamed protein product [Musa acuminata subsp. burmannicoides]